MRVVVLVVVAAAALPLPCRRHLDRVAALCSVFFVMAADPFEWLQREPDTRQLAAALLGPVHCARLPSLRHRRRRLGRNGIASENYCTGIISAGPL